MRRGFGSCFAFITAGLVLFACSGSKSYDYEYVFKDGGATGAGGLGTADAAADGGVSGSGGTGADSAAGDASDSSPDGTTFQDAGVHGRVLYVKASNPDAQDQFGETIAISDGWVAIGASNESSKSPGMDGDQSDDSEDDSGAVYLFSDDGRGWAQRAYVKASNPEAGDAFGSALALDGPTLAVGAWAEDGAATGINGDQEAAVAGNAGAVYVFERTSAGWTQEAYIKASNTDVVDQFGRALALDGATLVVGALGEDSEAAGFDGNQSGSLAPDSGAAYVFTRTANQWRQEAYLKASNPGVADEFGAAIALDGDTLVVGAPGESSNAVGVGGNQNDDSAEDSGAAYVFERAQGAWHQTAYLKSSNTDSDDRFGERVALDGDTLAVAALTEGTRALTSAGTERNNDAPESGAVYVFTRLADGWKQQAYLKASNAEAEDYFGVSLALLGDTLIVGALGEDGGSSPQSNAAPFSGAAYVFRRSGNTWTQQAYMKAPNSGTGDRFGTAAALAPNLIGISSSNEASDAFGLNGDQSNDRAPGSGTVFLYARDP